MLGKETMLLLLLTVFTLHCKVSAGDYFQCPSHYPEQAELLSADDTVITVPEHPRDHADDNATNPDTEYDNVPKWRMPLDDSQGYVTYGDGSYVELDFGSVKKLVGFATKGANNYRGETWVTEYKVFVATEENVWSPVSIDGETTMEGNDDKWTVVPHSFDELISARYFRLVVVAVRSCCWKTDGSPYPDQFLGFQLGVFGCDGDGPPKDIVCPDDSDNLVEVLGNEDTLITVSFDQQDDDDDNSTNPDPVYDNKPEWRLPLSDLNGWITYSDDVFVQLDFGSALKLVGFATKGANNYRGESWVTGYEVFSSATSESWTPISIGGVTDLTGNSDKMTVVKHPFDDVIVSRYFRLQVTGVQSCCWNREGNAIGPRQFVGLQLAVYACESPDGCQRFRTMEARDNANGCHGVVPVTRCQGPCESIQTVDIQTGRLMSNCPCCSATSTSMETIVYECDQHTESEEVTVIDGCTCKNC